MKFWKATVFSLLFILSLFTGLILHISQSDGEEYRALMEVVDSKKEVAPFTAKQFKEGTAKTLLLTQGDERRIGALSCESSVLCFAKEEKAPQLIEEMKNIHLVYQENLSHDSEGNPFQIILHLNAPHATYFYHQEKLEAEQVNLARFRLQGHHFSMDSMSSSPFFKGNADQITLSFGDHLPVFYATNLKVVTE